MSQLPPRRGRASDAFGFLPLSSDPCGSFIEATEIQAEPLQMRESVIGQNGIRPRLFLSQMLLLFFFFFLFSSSTQVGQKGRHGQPWLLNFFSITKWGKAGKKNGTLTAAGHSLDLFSFLFFSFFSRTRGGKLNSASPMTPAEDSLARLRLNVGFVYAIIVGETMC